MTNSHPYNIQLKNPYSQFDLMKSPGPVFITDYYYYY